MNRNRSRKVPGGKLTGSSCQDPELKRNPGLAADFITAPPQMARYMEQTASGRIIKSDPYEHSITLENGIRIDIDCILDIGVEIYS